MISEPSYTINFNWTVPLQLTNSQFEFQLRKDWELINWKWTIQLRKSKNYTKQKYKHIMKKLTQNRWNDDKKMRY